MANIPGTFSLSWSEILELDPHTSDELLKAKVKAIKRLQGGK